MSIKNLFHDRVYTGKHEDMYQSTKYHQLTSSTFMFGSVNYCVHCGKKALPVQEAIREAGFSTDYIDAGHRCTCDDAMKEMAENLAFVSGNFDEYLNPNKGRMEPSEKVISFVLSNRKRIDNYALSHSCNGKVFKGKSSESFLSVNKDKIETYVEDDYWKNQPLALFLVLVDDAFDSLKKQQIEMFKKQESKMEEISSIFKRKNKEKVA